VSSARSDQGTRPSVAAAISGVRRRVRLAFDPSPVKAELVVPTSPARPPQVEFVAYGADCILSGYVRLDADRLTDLLNAHDEYLLIDVLASDLLTEETRALPDLLVERDELLLMHAIGPRGNPKRRVRTRQFPIALGIGQFEIRGYLHCLPGTDPIASFHRRRPMVPLTEAWIEYAAGGVTQRRRVSDLVVNRRLVDWIVEAVDDEVEMPDVPLRPGVGPRAKDLTGHVRTDGDRA
jgi:hypothetical protein